MNVIVQKAHLLDQPKTEIQNIQSLKLHFRKKEIPLQVYTGSESVLSTNS